MRATQWVAPTGPGRGVGSRRVVRAFCSCLYAVRVERLQKYLAARGLGSRRNIEEWIAAGRISVDGELAQLGMRVDGSEIIRVNNELLARSRQSNVQVLLLNKRAGVICTRSDDQGRRTCFDELPSLREGRWISIGRLDIATSGLLLFTNDGELANRMMHPSTGLDREYAIRLDIRLSEEQETALKTGVEIDPGEMAKFSDLRYFRGGPSNYWYHLVLMEGRNRQVRRMFEAVNARVSRLKRVRFGPVIVPPGTLAGHFRELSSEDIVKLYAILGLPKPRLYQRKSPGRSQPKKAGKTTVLIPYPKLPVSN